MTQNTLATHVEKSQEALRALLKKLLGTEVPLEADPPEQISQDRSSTLRDAATSHFCLEAAEQNVLIALSPDWVPMLSEAMLGERLEAGTEGTHDLMQEVGSQAFGTVQSTLAAEGMELPGIQLEAAGIDTTPSPLDGSSWKISFSAEHEGTALEGLVLLPSGNDSKENDSKEEASPTQSFTERSPSESSSAQQSSSSSGANGDSSEVDVAPASFSDLGEENLEGNEQANSFELLAEVNLEVRVELGRRELPLADVLKLTTGSVVELEKMVGEPLSVYANGRLIAEGEAVVIDEQFGVRITNLASEDTRDKAFF